MNQRIALEAHTSFGPMTASAVLQVRPARDVVAEPSPVLKYLEIWNPALWSKDDFSRFAYLAGLLVILVELISKFLNGSP